MSDPLALLDEVKQDILDGYADRNLLAVGLARIAHLFGFHAGIRTDPDAPGWPVVTIDLPTGQVSYHVPSSLLRPETLPRYQGEWDGHSDDEKRRRLAEFAYCNLPEAPQ